MGKEKLERIPDEQIEAISGGVKNRRETTCPNCGGFYDMLKLQYKISEGDGGKIIKYQCPHCGHEWSRNVQKRN